MVTIPVTLAACAAAAILNFWLSQRVFQMRRAHQVIHGDGGQAGLLRRMRAQANFVEYTPFVLLLILAIELSGRGGLWLALVSGAYLLGRLAHAFGMDSEAVPAGRKIGMATTFLTLLGLAVYAALIAGGVA